eukprot:scaffold1282_cov251-Pinguiococcus_pyrenoidosus.AAC.67
MVLRRYRRLVVSTVQQGTARPCSYSPFSTFVLPGDLAASSSTTDLSAELPKPRPPSPPRNDPGAIRVGSVCMAMTSSSTAAVKRPSWASTTASSCSLPFPSSKAPSRGTKTKWTTASNPEYFLHKPGAAGLVRSIAFKPRMMIVLLPAASTRSLGPSLFQTDAFLSMPFRNSISCRRPGSPTRADMFSTRRAAAADLEMSSATRPGEPAEGLQEASMMRCRAVVTLADRIRWALSGHDPMSVVRSPQTTQHNRSVIEESTFLAAAELLSSSSCAPSSRSRGPQKSSRIEHSSMRVAPKFPSNCRSLSNEDRTASRQSMTGAIFLPSASRHASSASRAQAASVAHAPRSAMLGGVSGRTVPMNSKALSVITRRSSLRKSGIATRRRLMNEYSPSSSS